MNKKKNKFAIYLCRLGLGLVLSSSVVADHHWDTIEYQTIPIKENLYVMIAEGGNLAVSIGEDGTFLIDDQFAPLTGKIVDKIKKWAETARGF